MKQRLLTALFTVIVFAAGFVARMWTEGDKPFPPAPALGSEFINRNANDKKPAPRPIDRAKLVKDIETLQPQIDAYRTQLSALDSEFENAFVALLTPEQRKIYDARQADQQKRKAERDARAANTPTVPMTDEEIARERQHPFEIAFWRISYKGWLDTLTDRYKLTAEQRAKVHDLLQARRDHFLALVDSTPPPTFRLTTLVTSVSRLTDSGQPQPAPAK